MKNSSTQNFHEKGSIRLTQTVQKGGCAAKVAAHELRDLLSRVRFPPPGPGVQVDSSTFDDAAIVVLSDDTALVQTLDFFTPVVDSPETFGAIAAANALSDVYAMGGEPRTALAILAYPIAQFSPDIVAAVLQGASDVLREAGASLVGGHSIDDDTLKFGLSVTGEVHPRRVWTNAGAQIGDRLILTKRLGTGTLCAGLKRSAWGEDAMQEVLSSMKRLNRVRDLFSAEEDSAIHAATDVTGFGLAGHGVQMARASDRSLRVNFAKLPVFEPAAPSLREGFLTKAHRTNADYTAKELQITGGVDEVTGKILFDPQTSGGLLLSVAADRAEIILNKIRHRFPEAEIIGSVEAFSGQRVVVEG